ncbi:carbohydrate ABC transporter permease [Paenibacillus mucilaginosus]|uniref:Binding-protein-dependent transport systems inner membrane component n=1 Tax=Paenibacillus mucilaginosus (strain KNP414) TaxID=1036673 RepID=F8F7T1_PAEMK|nr:carbohydrate ABC transporter permease [Paenibacillus mucilaginosus]AEI40835.1 binding-protein-dependent transport systems inner membrane component [Paenibacillus mucilaginosus KNP414]MCG7211696.1 carbohydrate ABC transporter permease [Paenibacillus mucilaginosus]WDM29947.1 carbohydrate ABC transporter permease [Paenibacillus mucilaginosus]
MNKGARSWGAEFAAVGMTVILFWIPFYFIIVNAMKNTKESSLLNLAWPSSIHLWDNIKQVVAARDYMLLRAFYNSTVLTVLSILVLVFICAMAGYVMQRRTDKATPWINFLVLSGLIIPPAIVPTIWVLDSVGLFKTMTGLVLVEVALGFPFCVLLYKGFMSAIPREIDEAAIVDGCSGVTLFFRIILPLLQPVTATIIVTSSVGIFNDFTNPLYFFPGSKNATVQLTLYNFSSQYVTQWNLLFTNILLITLPPLLLFIFFNKKIVAGMTAGSVKG